MQKDEEIKENTRYTPQKTAEFLGVTIQTLRNWDRKGTFKATRTDGGHRRYLGIDIIKRLKIDV